jgi:methanogenic corrinoid protein MtbC1
MSNAEISREVLSISESETDFTNQINALTIAMVEMDEDRFEKIISNNVLRIGFEKTMVLVLYPFLQRVGTMWLTGAINPAQEHFISNLIRQKLIVAIDGQSSPSANAPKFLLFCPESEMHEIPLLFTNYLLRSRKFKVVYLGINLPFNDLKSVVDIHKPDYIFTILTTTPVGIDTQEYIFMLSKAFPKQRILISGQELNNYALALPKNVKQINSIDTVIELMEDIYPSKISTQHATSSN